VSNITGFTNQPKDLPKLRTLNYPATVWSCNTASRRQLSCVPVFVVQREEKGLSAGTW